MKTDILFEPIKINEMELKNRFVRSATHDACSSEDGRTTEKTIGLYTKLAQGGVGLIISGATYVSRNGQFDLLQNALFSDDFIPTLERLINDVHKHDTKIALQLHHSGFNSPYASTTGETCLAPSLLGNNSCFRFKHREINVEEIWQTINCFGEAARRAKRAGADAVQLHGAHGYLFSQFLSPYTNRRTDEWGGSLPNRMRFHTEVYKSIRTAVGDKFPVIIKLGLVDLLEGGLLLKDGCEVAKSLSGMGMDAIEVSHGMKPIAVNIGLRGKEAYYLEWAKEVKKVISVPLILVGGIRTYNTCKNIILRGYADCISMCRPFIREPDLVNRWRKGDLRPAKCVSCNLCMHREHVRRPILCVDRLIDRDALSKYPKPTKPYQTF